MAPPATPGLGLASGGGRDLAREIVYESVDGGDAPTTSEGPMGLSLSAMLLGGALVSLGPDEPPPPSPSMDPPGGYWSLGEQREREREPLDGDEELTLGAVLFSLGLIRAGGGVVTAWMAGRPDLCPLDQDADCGGLRVYGWVGVGEGGLLATTGLVYVIIGAVRRDRHRRWLRGESVSGLQLRPRAAKFARHASGGLWLTPPVNGAAWTVQDRLTGAGLQLRLRF